MESVRNKTWAGTVATGIGVPGRVGPKRIRIYTSRRAENWRVHRSPAGRTDYTDFPRMPWAHVMGRWNIAKTAMQNSDRATRTRVFANGSRREVNYPSIMASSSSDKVPSKSPSGSPAGSPIDHTKCTLHCDHRPWLKASRSPFGRVDRPLGSPGVLSIPQKIAP